MDEQLSEDLGRRIAELARLATAVHLEMALQGACDIGQKPATGGAGARGVGGADSGPVRKDAGGNPVALSRWRLFQG